LRFAGGGNFHEGHVHPFYYMELALLAGFVPWTILLPIVGVEAARAPRVIDPRLKYIFVWFAVVLIFYNLPQSKRGVYLLCLYPAVAALLAVYIRQTVARPQPARACVHGVARLSGVAILLIGGACLIALTMIVARPTMFAELVQAAAIRAPAFPRAVASAIARNALLALTLPIAVVAVGGWLLLTETLVERMVLAIAAAMVFITVAVNVVVVPAIANTLSLKDFTDHAMKVVDGSTVGYLDALNYDVAFYSRRTIPIVSLGDPDVPEYLIVWRALFEGLAASKRNRFDIVMVSNPTSLDGTDEMLLLHRRGSPKSPSKPSDSYIEAGNF
jgi:hypothetical protein